MRTSPRASFLFVFPLLMASGALAVASCANGLTVEDSGSGGSGGSDSSSSSSSSSSGMAGPCQTAQDCASFSDACNVGTCINGACTRSPMNEDAPCDDGKQCTTSDHCQGGVCTGELKFCVASDSCHVGVCDVATDSCMEVPGNNGAPCVDDDPCTQTGSCLNGACKPGPLVNCSFLDGVCSVGVCDPLVGCKSAPKNDGVACDDKFFCTVNDHCLAGVCMGDPKVCAPPSDVCKVGSCDEMNDKCNFVIGNQGGACDDLNACTMGETCNNGVCGGGVPTNQGGACDDHDGCTTIDACDNGSCLGSAAIAQCTDGDSCCPASCTLNNDADCVPACCGDKLNDFPVSNNCSQGAVWIAWKYVPSCSFNVTRLEIHSDKGNVALLDDNNDAPGSTLFQGMLGLPDANGWIGADVVPPIALTAGATYWIAENVSVCSIASMGNPPKYYGSFNTLAGPWSGPFMDVSNIWTAHIIGECAP